MLLYWSEQIFIQFIQGWKNIVVYLDKDFGFYFITKHLCSVGLELFIFLYVSDTYVYQYLFYIDFSFLLLLTYIIINKKLRVSGLGEFKAKRCS